jgi:uncharacterized protein YjiS (DUF1127 family)
MSRMNMAIDAFDETTDIRRAAPRPILSTVWSTVAASATNMMSAYAKRRRHSRAIAELNALSDHMLRDIGIERHDIVRIVRNGRDADDIRA